jgi:hypothetical protein
MAVAMRLSSLCLLLLAVGCGDAPPAGPQFFERVIQPILTQNCVFNQGACHKADDAGNALGNLDLTSYANLAKRRDTLRQFGSYPLPLMLLKATGSQSPPIPYKGRTDGTTALLPIEIQHVGGTSLNVNSSAFFALRKWMNDGAAEDGSLVVRPKQTGTGGCNPDFAKVRPDVAAALASVDTTTQAFKDFAANVEPLLAKSCTYGTCHSAEQSDFFLTCQGSGSDDLSKFNFLEAQAFVANPAASSPILLKPLSSTHTGGVFFTTTTDPAWQKLSAWASEVGPAPPPSQLSDGEKFFRDHVMPVLLKRGCTLEGCHSPGAPNDFKLRAGTQGFFSNFTLAYNYSVARHDFLMPEVPDVRQSRLAKKPIVAVAHGGFGIAHRGGPPLQGEGEQIDPAACPQPWPGDDKTTAFCTVAEWHRIERQALLAAATPLADLMAAGSTEPLVVVARPPDGDRLIDFDTYRPGADLLLGKVGLGALGAIDPASAAVSSSLLGNCAGVAADRSNVDVRHPAVNYDATKVAFAMRLGAGDSLDLYEVTLDSAHTCTKVTDGNGRQQNGLPIHNLDPMYAPDGTLVFASTRGGAGGPTRSQKYLLPQTDLWRMRPNGASYGAPTQMTALLNSELGPAMMANGQISFTAEKASADFYQLSGRRINWDLTDYHPLLGQRAVSVAADFQTTHPSIDYQQATEIREGVDRNFVLVLSDDGCRGAGGTIGIFNRSIGPFESDRTDIQFLHSLTIPDAAATGRAGTTNGAYRSPFPLPDGRILASYAGVTDGTQSPVRYDVVVLDPATGQRQALAGFGGGGKSWVEAVLVYRREPRPLFDNLTQLIFGGHVDGGDAQHGTVHYPDLPMLGTLLGANLRTGRFVDHLRSAQQVVIYQDLPPPSDLAAAMAGQTGSQKVYQSRKELGRGTLAADGSVQLRLPALTPLIIELSANGSPLFTMSEEDQLGPGEHISRGVPQALFNSVCAGCHGSVSGSELDITVNPDALTGASVSLSRDRVQPVGP